MEGLYFEYIALQVLVLYIMHYNITYYLNLPGKFNIVLCNSFRLFTPPCL